MNELRVAKNAIALSAFIEVVPPPHLEHWSCEDVEYTITLVSPVGEVDLNFSDTFTFTNETTDRGWHDIFKKNGDNWHSWYESKYMGADGEVVLRAKVSNVPVIDGSRSFEHFKLLDFASELKVITFCLAEGKLFFDQRLLMARSEYFQKMLTSQEWTESQRGEIDFSSDSRVTLKSMTAMLRFILTDVFKAEADIETAISVRELADRFCIPSLVERVDKELQLTLTEENVLQLLGKMHDTGSEVETACWKILDDNPNILANAEADLRQVSSDPTLASKLIVSGWNKAKRARR